MMNRYQHEVFSAKRNLMFDMMRKLMQDDKRLEHNYTLFSSRYLNPSYGKACTENLYEPQKQKK